MKKAMLMILDGWGIGQNDLADAIHAARTPYYDLLIDKYPNSSLVTYGPEVGLPDGQFGNSEVGHLNLGAGRVVYQDLGLIDKAFKSGEMSTNSEFLDLISYCEKHDKPLHIIGLVSDGGVHSHINHLFGLIDLLEATKVKTISIHAILDGRDTDPHSGIHFIEKTTNYLQGKRSRIVSIIGRYFAMDRDKRWERTKKAYDLYIHGIGKKTNDFCKAIIASYETGTTDEFLDAYCSINPVKINNEDAVLCFNFRTDRLRQLTEALTQNDFPEFDMSAHSLHYVTMTNYKEEYKNIRVLFGKQDILETLGETLSRYGLTQLRIAETEKYPHVSFFFNGGKESKFVGERRILIPSPKVATYDLQPEMSASTLTQSLLEDIQNNHPDFICINFANADMVGHTGVYNAVVKAIESVDSCLEKIIPFAQLNNYEIIILADHGNAEFMINTDGSPNTAHTMNPVPCILISNNKTLKLKNGKLADIAPTLLNLMELPVPEKMTGNSLI
ncbi:MAG: 2,3-bisphosphoglycerate-independent phosphoglycerate mutase [Saprospiraceae bacterium]|nr:2,3-bisphosphoglycerate-independent phosphoglycerate mutase [Candidatus Vicinibacter affinis]HQX43284.1 2,3-bisphosphoglycerate-independent phosphoglycerate mutase [Saprospiraceae bacterium]MBK6822111.1 2,3-bisphosphoglycerate-independent phosphoglycerate mutase [Candidatus Vicinibacter affinis]MBK7302093.1 2,3-bisphosphoglycerate-independent phosphoglycerate mutase [Candidatus Vicinibacter affinis]MBK7693235.1 2,3-bisphosphoglycerate-independent phosphoglycerate mutase [Candidatus Vicinibac